MSNQVIKSFCLLSLLLILSGCGTELPAYQRVMDQFLTALREHDADALEETIDMDNETNSLLALTLAENFEALVMAENMHDRIVERFGTLPAETFKKETLTPLQKVQNSFNFNEPEITPSGSTATVKMGGTDIPIRMVRVDQGWKIDFSPFIELASADAMYTEVHLQYLVLKALQKEFDQINQWEIFLERYQALRTQKQPGAGHTP